MIGALDPYALSHPPAAVDWFLRAISRIIPPLMLVTPRPSKVGELETDAVMSFVPQVKRPL